ncbi:helix-turn-helix domain-containing protein [Aureimonas phyllosphaerae]|uniref:Transcriptional regulator with XRE-family HTH domain n=1 Tax=Aureimonas phyllosphaerae TaxID=1166078 RepID=A0A7W6BQB1_9HYPH|nr:helix-turn-helix transcriptional regulator [Aureimonas phyllosphaerae]MBB3936111.1 transcriptional regulator with XRE-family HTH domain [Aureimonas phyllosphaerae]MBB3960164.1 transcriptional regulator with XRE-family HTH domain [Aureimonas phyllosphaerae]SFF33916.1 Helix-turn-helix domain-containing protein [Aureimonas phyllosphaerae]
MSNFVPLREELIVPSKDPIDTRIGSRLRAAREMRRMTLGQVGRSMGLTYQQIRKYESGENRLSASRLYHLSVLLSVDPGYFFRGLDGESDAAALMADGEPTLAAALDRIGSPEVRHHLRSLIEVLDIDFSSRARLGSEADATP